MGLVVDIEVLFLEEPHPIHSVSFSQYFVIGVASLVLRSALEDLLRHGWDVDVFVWHTALGVSLVWRRGLVRSALQLTLRIEVVSCLELGLGFLDEAGRMGWWAELV